VSLFSANDLFSHPEATRPDAQPGAAEHEQPSWTNLFQEPVPAPRVPANH